MKMADEVKFYPGEFGVRYRALTQAEIEDIQITGDDNPNVWYQVEPNQKSSRNTSVEDTHAWARKRIGPYIQPGLVLYAEGLKSVK